MESHELSAILRSSPWLFHCTTNHFDNLSSFGKQADMANSLIHGDYTSFSAGGFNSTRVMPVFRLGFKDLRAHQTSETASQVALEVLSTPVKEKPTQTGCILRYKNQTVS